MDVFGSPDIDLKQLELEVDELISGYAFHDGDAGRIDLEDYVFRDNSVGDRPIGRRYKDALYCRQSVAVGGDDHSFYGLRNEGFDGDYLAVVEHPPGDRISAVGIRKDVYEKLDAGGRETLRSDAVNSVEELGGVPETPPEEFCKLVLEDPAL